MKVRASRRQWIASNIAKADAAASACPLSANNGIRRRRMPAASTVSKRFNSRPVARFTSSERGRSQFSLARLGSPPLRSSRRVDQNCRLGSALALLAESSLPHRRTRSSSQTSICALDWVGGWVDVRPMGVHGLQAHSISDVSQLSTGFSSQSLPSIRKPGEVVT